MPEPGGDKAIERHLSDQFEETPASGEDVCCSNSGNRTLFHMSTYLSFVIGAVACGGDG